MATTASAVQMDSTTATTETAELLTEIEAAEFLRLSVKTLRRWRDENRGCPWMKLEGAVRYRRSELEQWMEERTNRP